jgi:hypothetical protein
VNNRGEIPKRGFVVIGVSHIGISEILKTGDQEFSMKKSRD